MTKNKLNTTEEFDKLDEGQVIVTGKVESPAPVKGDLEEMIEGAPEPLIPEVDEVSQPATPAAGQPQPEGMVAVPAAEWKKVQETLEILRESANQGKLSQAENKRRPKELPRAFLKVFDGHVIVGWKSAQSELMYAPNNPTTAVGERLKAEYFFVEGGSTGIVDQVFFTREEDRAWVRIKKKEGTKLTVEFESNTSEFGKPLPVIPGQELVIDMNFINP